MTPKNRGNLTKLGRTKGPSKVWSTPKAPFNVHIQYNRTRNFIAHPSKNINWARVVNRKTYSVHTNELLEDLKVNHEVPMEVLTRPLPCGVSHIKTIFEYGEMPTHTGKPMRKLRK